MRRMALDLLITLDRSDDAAEGLTRQIYAQVRQAILSGRLRAGDRLPPSRALAHDLAVARLTVATAYDWLRAEGYVSGRVGAGTFVAPVFEGYAAVERADDRVERPLHAETTPTQSVTPLRPALTTWARRIQAIPLMGAGTVDGSATGGVDTGAEGAEFDFRPSVGAADLFPWARWRRIVTWQDDADPMAELRAQARERAAQAGRWDALLGPLETRAAIAAWLRRSRAVRCDPDQLLIASSVQQVLALLARLLVEPGQPLLVEDPSYIGFHAAFLAEGADLRGIPVDQSGIRVDALPERDATGAPTDARLLIVTPSHQYPTGVTLSMERRVALIEWARRVGATLVEDDYDGDLRLEGQPLEALRGLDERDEVIYLGTFAKALYPAVRLAFAALPRWLIEPVARARAASDRHPSWRDALAVARFIEAGELERHLARMRRVYRGRRDALVAALAAEVGDVAQIGPAEAGIHLLATLPAGTDDRALAKLAHAHGVAVGALSPHYQAHARPGLLLGFGAMSEDRLEEGVRRLAPLIHAAVADRRETLGAG